MAKFPSDLESQYSRLFSKVIENINKKYLKLIRQFLNERETVSIINQCQPNTRRFNVGTLSQLLKKLKGLKASLSASEIFQNVFDSMKGIFTRADQKIIKNIRKEFTKLKFPVPEILNRTESFVLKQAVSDNASLITGISSKHIENLENAVFESVQHGGSINEIMEVVTEQAGRGKAYAEFVARDQVAKVHAAIDTERQKQVGFTGYIWITTEDSRVRPEHRKQHGKFFTWENPPLIRRPGKAGDANLQPGEDFGCRCIKLPAFNPLDVQDRNFKDTVQDDDGDDIKFIQDLIA